MPYNELPPSSPGPRGMRNIGPIYKYAVYPGMVSLPEGGHKYVPFRDLCRLYGVQPRDCFEVLGRNATMPGTQLIPLHPRQDGNYTYPGLVAGGDVIVS